MYKKFTVQEYYLRNFSSILSISRRTIFESTYSIYTPPEDYVTIFHQTENYTLSSVERKTKEENPACNVKRGMRFSFGSKQVARVEESSGDSSLAHLRVDTSAGERRVRSHRYTRAAVNTGLQHVEKKKKKKENRSIDSKETRWNIIKHHQRQKKRNPLYIIYILYN